MHLQAHDRHQVYVIKTYTWSHWLWAMDASQPSDKASWLWSSGSEWSQNDHKPVYKHKDNIMNCNITWQSHDSLGDAAACETAETVQTAAKSENRENKWGKLNLRQDCKMNRKANWKLISCRSSNSKNIDDRRMLQIVKSAVEILLPQNLTFMTGSHWPHVLYFHQPISPSKSV